MHGWDATEGLEVEVRDSRMTMYFEVLGILCVASCPLTSCPKSLRAVVCGCCLQVPEEVVNVKAKTHEKVDSLGENRSVGCHCVVLLMRA